MGVKSFIRSSLSRIKSMRSLSCPSCGPPLALRRPPASEFGGADAAPPPVAAPLTPPPKFATLLLARARLVDEVGLLFLTLVGLLKVDTADSLGFDR